MRRLILALALLLAAPFSAEAAKYLIASGSWTDASKWSDIACGSAVVGSGAPVIAATDDVHLCGLDVTVPAATDIGFKSLVDDSAGASFTMDHSAVTAGQVGSIRIGGTSSADGVQFSNGGAFIVKGRTIYSDADGAKLGSIDFVTASANCTTTPAGAVKTAAGTAATNNGDCYQVTYPDVASGFVTGTPVGGPVVTPTGWPGTLEESTLDPRANGTTIGGKRAIIVMRDGALAYNFLVAQNIVTGGSPAMYLSFGSSYDDLFAAYKVATDVTVSSWDLTNPMQQTATLPTASVGGGNLVSATMKQQGQCLISPANNYYRINKVVDGGGSSDTIIVEPTVKVLTSDAASAGWTIAPCLKRGDSFIAYEPVQIRPLTTQAAGSAASALMHQGFSFRGTCPVLENVWMEQLSNVATNDPGNTIGLGSTMLYVNYDPGCTINGPIAVDGVHYTSGEPYVFASKSEGTITVNDLMIQGFYAHADESALLHGITAVDTRRLVFNRYGYAWGNNEAMWSGNDTDGGNFEGVNVVFRGASVHDNWLEAAKAGSDAGGGSLSIICSTFQFGDQCSLDIDDLRSWNNETGATYSAEANATNGYAYITNSWFGPIHPPKDATTGTYSVVSGASAYNQTGSKFYAANNVFSLQPMYGSELRYVIRGFDNWYSYFGGGYAVLTQNVMASNWTLKGNIIDGDNSLSAQTTRHGIQFQARDANSTGTYTIEDTIMKRNCANTGATVNRFIGISWDSGSVASETPTITWEFNTLAPVCGGLAAMTDASAVANANGGAITNTVGDRGLATGSSISHNLFVTGDNVAGHFNTWPIRANNGTSSAGPMIWQNNACSSCRLNASTCNETTTACANNLDSGATMTPKQTNFQLNDDPSKMGFRDYANDDYRLTFASPAWGDSEVGVEHMGARYSGVTFPFAALRDSNIPFEFVSFQAAAGDSVEWTAIPVQIRSRVVADGLSYLSGRRDSNHACIGVDCASHIGGN